LNLFLAQVEKNHPRIQDETNALISKEVRKAQIHPLVGYEFLQIVFGYVGPVVRGGIVGADDRYGLS
jgi:hypothetical protein